MPKAKPTAPVVQPPAKDTKKYESWIRETGKGREKDDEGNKAAQNAAVKREVRKGK